MLACTILFEFYVHIVHTIITKHEILERIQSHMITCSYILNKCAITLSFEEGPRPRRNLL